MWTSCSLHQPLGSLMRSTLVGGDAVAPDDPAERRAGEVALGPSGMPAMVTEQNDRQVVGLGCPLHPRRHRRGLGPDNGVAVGGSYPAKNGENGASFSYARVNVSSPAGGR